MANKSDKRIAAENASTRTLLLAGTALTQVGAMGLSAEKPCPGSRKLQSDVGASPRTQLLQLLLFAISSRQRTRAHLLLYLFTSLPSLFFTQQLYSMASPKYSSSGALVSAGADLTQPGLTQYMQDVIYVTWAAQLFGLIWSKGWWLYALVSGRLRTMLQAWGASAFCDETATCADAILPLTH